MGAMDAPEGPSGCITFQYTDTIRASIFNPLENEVECGTISQGKQADCVCKGQGMALPKGDPIANAPIRELMQQQG